MLEQFVDFLAKVVEGLLIAAAPIVVGFVIQWLRAKTKQALSYIDDEWTSAGSALRLAAELAVKAAEQVGLTHAGMEDKLQYAVAVAQEYLDNEGIDISIDLIVAAIEAAVFDEFNKEEPAGRAG